MSSEIVFKFGIALKTIRTWRGMFQQELADLVGIPTSLLSRIETGVVLPTASTEELIRKTLRWEEALEELAKTSRRGRAT